MKRFLTVLLVCCMVLAMAACGSKSSASETAVSGETSAETEAVLETETADEEQGADDTAELLGGWTVVDAEAAELPEEAQTAFDKASEGWVGTDLKPVALIGSQTVSGVNYAILAKATTVTAEPVMKNVLVIVYADLNGGAEIKTVADLDGLDAYSSDEASGLTGGWEIADVTGSMPGEEEAALLEKAQEGYTGESFSLVAELSEQLVAGTNHRYFCRSVTVSSEPASGLCVVTVYADLNGNAEITDVQNFDIANFNE